MDAIYDLAPEPGTDRIMLVMLPGAKARPQDLVRCGFVRALRERSLPIDVVVVGAHLGYYLGRSLGKHLRHDIIAPARARNYQRIWLMGISLGGMGSLIYTREHAADIEGVILLAPFLGARGTIAEVVHAGGLALATQRNRTGRRRAPAAGMDQGMPTSRCGIAKDLPGLRDARPVCRGEQDTRGALAGGEGRDRSGRSRLGDLAVLVATLSGSGIVFRRQGEARKRL